MTGSEICANCRVGYWMTATSFSRAEIYQIIGNRIRSHREKLNLTQEKLGERVGLTRVSITNIEKGRQKLLVHTLIQFAAALSIPVGDLIAPFDQNSSTIRPEQLPTDLTPAARNWILSGVAASKR